MYVTTSPWRTFKQSMLHGRIHVMCNENVSRKKRSNEIGNVAFYLGCMNNVNVYVNAYLQGNNFEEKWPFHVWLAVMRKLQCFTSWIGIG